MERFFWWFRCVASWRSPCIDEIWRPTKSPINLPQVRCASWNFMLSYTPSMTRL
jgi:hypothetical protein